MKYEMKISVMKSDDTFLLGMDDKRYMKMSTFSQASVTRLDVKIQKMSISSGASKSLYSIIGRGSLRRLQTKKEKKGNSEIIHAP